MLTIYWIRHGEAEGNLYRRCHGHYDSLITPNGRAQADALRARFEGVGLDAVYSSDLYRAWYTAAALATPRGQAVTVHPCLREVALGVWEDLPWIEIGMRYAQEYEGLVTRPWAFSIPGGESMTAARDRAVAALRDIISRHYQPGKDASIAIVSHGLVTRGVMSRIQGLPDERMGTLPHGDNTSVTKLNYDNGAFGVEYYADNSHLGELSTLARQRWWRGKGGFDQGFWFKAVKFPSEGKYIEKYRRDAWVTIYGGMENFSGPAFVEEARRQSLKQPETVLFAMNGRRRAGILHIDYDSPILPYGGGHITFLYLLPEYRGMGLGAQLLGQAISACRTWGHRNIGLRVYDGNVNAVKFYKKYGFTVFGDEPSYFGTLLLMSADIGVPPL